MEHESVDILKSEIARIAGKHLDTGKYRVFFFGSRVRGNSTPRSDIDIGIEGREELPLRVKGEIEEEIEALPVLYEMDVVDFTAASEKFRNFARRWTEPII